MNLSKKQTDTKEKIEVIAKLLDLDPSWTVAIAMVESSLGEHQRSPTGCRGVFQMSTIAMKDLLISMESYDDDMIDIMCGVLFIRLLLKRWKTWEGAISHFCDPADWTFYLDRVKKYRKQFKS